MLRITRSRCVKPNLQVPVDASPSQWWQHAMRCICRERISLLDNTTPAIVTSDSRAMRHAYMKAYLDKHGPRRWLQMLCRPWQASTKTLKVRAN